jgi:hypothetical protein
MHSSLHFVSWALLFALGVHALFFHLGNIKVTIPIQTSSEQGLIFLLVQNPSSVRACKYPKKEYIPQSGGIAFGGKFYGYEF